MRFLWAFRCNPLRPTGFSRYRAPGIPCAWQLRTKSRNCPGNSVGR
ncbi:MAG: hypothetical protein LBK44_04115 [Spirochaetales bacterium]|nr:hypothetical protein [Spirochaetales bacterium]